MIAFTEDGLPLDVRVDAEKETVWLTQTEMAELFNAKREGILYHLRNIYQQGELDKGATCKEILQVQTEAGRLVRRTQPICNLDVIISVGYRVNSKRGIAFEASTYEESSVVRCEINVSPRDLCKDSRIVLYMPKFPRRHRGNFIELEARCGAKSPCLSGILP